MLTPRQLFFLDACGALLSALLLGLLLPAFQENIGVPLNVLYWLAGLAALFACYSFTCVAFLPGKWPVYLRLVAAVNLLYCCLTAALLCYHSEITLLGIFYFAGEITVVATLAIFEWRYAAATQIVKGK